MSSITINTNDNFTCHWTNDEGLSSFISFKFIQVDPNNSTILQCIQI